METRRKDELTKICKGYVEMAKIIMDLTCIITKNKRIDNKYKNLIHCFDDVELPEVHYSISASLLGRMGLVEVENIQPMQIDFENLSCIYLYSGALVKYDLHKDEYVDKYIKSQTDTILSLSDKAKILNTIKDYDNINDNEYYTLIKCIGELVDNAINTGEVLKDITESSKKEEER